jgi:hypothetical protein
MFVVLGLRRQLLQCVLLQEMLQPQQRQQLAAVVDVALAELQLQAAGQLAAQRCPDAAKVLLQEHEADVQRVRAAQLVGQQQAALLDAWRCCVAVEVAVAQLQSCPGEGSYKQLLERNMQVSCGVK